MYQIEADFHIQHKRFLKVANDRHGYLYLTSPLLPLDLVYSEEAKHIAHACLRRASLEENPVINLRCADQPTVWTKRHVTGMVQTKSSKYMCGWVNINYLTAGTRDVRCADKQVLGQSQVHSSLKQVASVGQSKTGESIV